MMASASVGKQRWIVPATLALFVLALWLFPRLWYSKKGDGEKTWFLERSVVDGWTFESIPISETAERSLVADRIVNGEFKAENGEAVRVFSAKRFVENPNEIGLFVHTPDRCWVQGGWRVESISPDVRDVVVEGVRLTMERRLFRLGGNKELVYFCGLVDGQALPYRLDHNLRAPRSQSNITRASEKRFRDSLWNSFVTRRHLSGPKQFIRISTPVSGEEIEDADARLEQFLGRWLTKGDYNEERAHLRTMAKR